jgi:hypothetical protein
MANLTLPANLAFLTAEGVLRVCVCVGGGGMCQWT